MKLNLTKSCFYPGSGIQHPGSATSFLCLFLLLFLSIAGCGRETEIVVTGRTMGTTYQVKAYGRPGISTAALSEKIDLRLEQLNQVFSTYRTDSEISRFNRFDRVGEPYAVSEDFIRVMKTAREVYRITHGAWDGTVDPLVRLWGFHEKKPPGTPPSEDEINSLLQRVGFSFIEVHAGKSLVKRRADVSLDLASIAKGYAVDEIAVLLRGEGFDRYLVEIGGEVFASGRKPDDSAWAVGINRPEPDAPIDSVYRVVRLVDRALATSGDYRNFFIRNGWPKPASLPTALPRP